MKNKLLKLALTTLTICSFNAVKAERLTCEDVVSTFYSGSYFDSVYQSHYKGVFYRMDRTIKKGGKIQADPAWNQFGNYLIASTDGYAYTMYCRNPGMPTGVGKNTNVKFTCVSGEDDGDVGLNSTYDRNIYNAGIIAILNNGYQYRMPISSLNGKWINSNNNKIEFRNKKEAGITNTATELALRIYEMLWEPFGTSTVPASQENGDSSGGQSIYETVRYMAVKILGDNKSVLMPKIKKLREKTSDEITILGYNSQDEAYLKDLLPNVTIRGLDWYWGFDAGVQPWIYAKEERIKIDNEIWNKVYTLLDKGIQGAIDYVEKGPTEVKVNKTKDQTLVTAYDGAGNKVYQKIIEYNLDVKNFKSGESEIKLNFTCDNCARLSATPAVYIKGEGINQKATIKNGVIYINGTQNLVDLLKNGSGTFIVQLVYDIQMKNNPCGNIKSTLKVDYHDESFSTEIFAIKSTASYCSSGDCQNFYLPYNHTDEVREEKILNDEFRVCDLNCDGMKKQCNNGNADACEVFNEVYGGKCVTCGTNLKNDTCSNGGADISITEGTEYDENTCANKSNPTENILQCVIDNEDEAGNSYEATEIVKNNRYCTVWCKEDFEFELPGIKKVNSGRYFGLNASIEGTKTCYTSEILKSAFARDYKEAKEALDKANEAYKKNRKKPLQTKAKQAFQNLKNIVDEYNSCSNWTLTYDFNPKVEFWYEETFINSAITNKLETVGTIDKASANYQRCNGSINDGYTTCSTGWKSSNTVETLTVERYNGGFNNYQFEISNTRRMKATITASGDYITPTQFFAVHPSGAIVASQLASITNATPLTNGLPVGLNTKSGTYNYTLKVKDLGEYYSSDKVGRVWGDDNSLIASVLTEHSKNTKCTAGSLVSGLNINGTKFNGGVYRCSYVVDCPTCDVTCTPSGCTTDDDKPNNLDFNYRPVTPDALVPDNRKPGINWNSDDKSSAEEVKAHVTTEEIKSNGEKIFNTDFSTNKASDEFAMKVTLNYKTISKIKEYNKKYENDGGYLNNSLDCYDYVNSKYDKKTYKNIFCYSNLLDELLKDNGTKEFIQITGGTRYLTETDRKTKSYSSGYWVPWSDVNRSKWNVVQDKHVSNYGTNINIGPAWK